MMYISQIITLYTLNLGSVPHQLYLSKTGRKKIKDTKELNNQLPIMNIYRTFHLTVEYTFYSCAPRTFTKIEHILGYKTNLNKFKHVEIIQSIFSDHNGIKLEINKIKDFGKSPNTPNTQSNTLLKNSLVKEEVSTYQNLYKCNHSMLIGKFIVLKACILKKERFQTNDLKKHSFSP